MAMKLNAGEVGRTDLYSFFPEFVIANPEDNSRVDPHTPEEIAALAASIKEHGQEQPALVRRIEGNKVKLVAGYGRHQAITLLNQQNPDNPIKLQCKVADLNDEEAFVKSIVENNDRKNTNARDDAHAQRKLREVYGWTEERIAKFYDCSLVQIGNLRKILALPTAIQDKVADNTIPISTAMDLAELPAPVQVATIAEATNPVTGKVNGEVVRKKVRDQKIAAGGGKGRSPKEVRAFLESLLGPAEPVSVRKLSTALLSFMSGKITDKQMNNAMEKHCVPDVVIEPVATEQAEPVVQDASAA